MGKPSLPSPTLPKLGLSRNFLLIKILRRCKLIITVKVLEPNTLLYSAVMMTAINSNEDMHTRNIVCSALSENWLDEAYPVFRFFKNQIELAIETEYEDFKYKDLERLKLRIADAGQQFFPFHVNYLN